MDFLEKFDDVYIVNGWLTPAVVIGKAKLGKYISKIYIDLGVTPKKFAEMLDISEKILSEIETRRMHVSRELINKIIDVMSLNETESKELLRLSLMNNTAIELEKVTLRLMSESCN